MRQHRLATATIEAFHILSLSVQLQQLPIYPRGLQGVDGCSIGLLAVGSFDNLIISIQKIEHAQMGYHLGQVVLGLRRPHARLRECEDYYLIDQLLIVL